MNASIGIQTISPQTGTSQARPQQQPTQVNGNDNNIDDKAVTAASDTAAQQQQQSAPPQGMGKYVDKAA